MDEQNKMNERLAPDVTDEMKLAIKRMSRVDKMTVSQIAAKVKLREWEVKKVLQSE